MNERNRAPCAITDVECAALLEQPSAHWTVQLCRGTHWFTIAIIALTVMVHCAGGVECMQWVAHEWPTQPWRMLTYSLVHKHTEHLVTNMCALLVFGWCVEQWCGCARMCALWALGAVGGALACGVFEPSTHMLGASGVCLAIMASYTPLAVYRWCVLRWPWAWVCGSVVLCGFALCCPGGGGGAEVAWWSHCGGALGGLLGGFVLFTGGGAMMRYVRVTCATLSLVMMLAACWVLFGRMH